MVVSYVKLHIPDIHFHKVTYLTFKSTINQLYNLRGGVATNREGELGPPADLLTNNSEIELKTRPCGNDNFKELCAYHGIYRVIYN